MADWKKNRQKFQMPHDRVERCMRYVKAVEKDRNALKRLGKLHLISCCSNGGR